MRTFSDKCLYCGVTYKIIAHPETITSLMAFKLKVEEYVKHRIKCAANFFEQEAKCQGKV